MIHRISYVRGGRRFAVSCKCSRGQAEDIARFLPCGKVLDAPNPNDPEAAAIYAVLVTRAELARIAEMTRC
jgi:hypothetical protein